MTRLIDVDDLLETELFIFPLLNSRLYRPDILDKDGFTFELSGKAVKCADIEMTILNFIEINYELFTE